jgi:hypothetical protein
MEAVAAARLLADTLDKETVPTVREALARSLGVATGRLEPAAAARLLADALEKETYPPARCQLAAAVFLRPGMAQTALPEGTRLSTKAVRLVADDLTKEKVNFNHVLVQTLGAGANHLDLGEATALARRLANDLASEANTNTLSYLAESLGLLATCIEPAEAARLCAAAAQSLAKALNNADKERDSSARSRLLVALGRLAARMEPTEATTSARQLLAVTVPKLRILPEYRALASALGALALRMEPAAARLLADELDKLTPWVRSELVQALVAIAARLENEEAVHVLASALGKEADSKAQDALARALVTAATRPEPGEVASRSLLAARIAMGGATKSLDPWYIFTLVRGTEPLPCRFTTQQLVDLLKMPTCVGPARTVILEMLSNRYHRTFADLWEFVEFAEKKLPDIDLKSPPKRPLLRASE